MAFTIRASAGPNCSISPSGNVSITPGGHQYFTFTASPGYALRIFVNGVSLGDKTAWYVLDSYLFSNVMSSHTIEVIATKTYLTITAISGINGTITNLGITPITEGGHIYYSFFPDPGYIVDYIFVDGVSLGDQTAWYALQSYLFSNVMSSHTIEVGFIRQFDIVGITSSATGSGTIVPSGIVSVDIGANKTFTITPFHDSSITSVLVDGVPVSIDVNGSTGIGSYTFTNLQDDHTIQAMFPYVTYPITATAGANGSISPLGSTSVSQGGSQTFTITPNAQYAVESVLVDGVSVGPVRSYTFGNVQTAHTIHVTFSNNIKSIVASAGPNGVISPSGTQGVTIGQSRTFNFTANAGYQIDTVTVDGVSQGTISSYTFSNVQTDHTISVTFKLFDSYLITATSNTGGTISPYGSVAAVKGTNKSFTITPDAHSQITDVLVDGVSQGVITSYTFTNVQAEHTISVTFAIDSYSIISAAGPNGTIVPLGTTMVSYGGNQGYVITPNEGYRIQDIIVDGVAVVMPSSGALFITD
jgi:hypothetical protein